MFKAVANQALRIIGFFICLFARLFNIRASVSNEREKKVGKIVEVAISCSKDRDFSLLPTGLQDWLHFVPFNGDYEVKIRNASASWARKHTAEVDVWYRQYRDDDIVQTWQSTAA